MSCKGVSQARSSALSIKIAASEAVNDFVVEAAWKRVYGVNGTSGKVA